MKLTPFSALSNYIFRRREGPADSDVNKGVTAYLPFLFLFFGYPLALVFPGGSWGPQLRFHFQLPVFFWLSLFTTAMLLTMTFTGKKPGRKNSPSSGTADKAAAAATDSTPPNKGGRIFSGWLKPVFIALLVYIFCSSVLSSNFSLIDTLTVAGYFSIPLYFAVSPRCLKGRALSGILALLWLISSLHGLFQLLTGAEVAGIAGNRNWMASLTLALAPWAGLFCWQSIKTVIEDKFKQGILVTIIITGIGIISLPLLTATASRAAWLGLTIYLLVLLPGWYFATKKRRPAIYALWIFFLVFAVSAAGWKLRDNLGAVYAQDIRGPLWQNTAELIIDNPVYGVGAGNFRSAFTAYRSPAQLARKVAGAVTEHPHNQILHLAAETGIPPALIWGLCLIPLLRIPRWGRKQWAVHFSAFIIIFHSMFDKVMVQPPTNMLGLVFLGLYWRPVFIRYGDIQAFIKPSRRLRLLIYPLLAFFLTIALLHTVSTGTGTWFLRKGLESEYRDEFEKAIAGYSEAGVFMPDNPKPFALAGEIALEKLQQPRRALEFYQKALSVEPDYGHINFSIGMALGQLGDHKRAKDFFKREVMLFPSSIRAHEYAIRSKILSAEAAGLSEWQKQLADIRRDKRLEASSEKANTGSGELAQLADRWQTAVNDGETATAVRAAQALAPAELYYNPAQPRSRELLNSMPELQPFFKKDFHPVDFSYWQTLIELTKLSATEDAPDEVIAGADFHKHASGTKGNERAFIVAEIFRQFGYDAAAVKFARGDAAENRQEGKTGSIWLVQVFDKKNTPAVIEAANFTYHPGTTVWDFAAGERTQEISPLSGQPPDSILLRLSCWPQELAAKNEVLGQILAGVEGSRQLPKLGEPPLLRFIRWQERVKNINNGIKLDVKLDWSWSKSILSE